MKRGLPLTDGDRDLWLSQLRRAIDEWRSCGENVILACSALKQRYRERLRCCDRDVQVVYLKGTAQEIRQRLAQRQDHFMPERLLKSQFDALEEPQNAITVDIQHSSPEIVQHIIDALDISAGGESM